MSPLIVVPTYQEVDNIVVLIAQIRQHVPDAAILVVDDGSPDGTADVVEALGDPGTRVMRRTSKDGLGVAYRAAFAHALDAGSPIIVQMDADGSHRPADLPRMLAAVETADVVIGSRWVPGGAVVNWPASRRAISRIGNLYARLMLGLRIHDATAGYRVFTRAALHAIDLDSVASQGYCFQIDMARRAVDAGLTVVEVPITFVERERGTSKMSGAIVREALWRVTVWGVARVVGRG